MRLGAYRIIEQPDLDPRLHLRTQDFLQAFGERVRPPDEVLEMNRVPRSFNVLHYARVKFGRVLLNLHMVAPGQRGIGVAPDEHHELFMAGTFPLEPGDLRILAGQQRREKGKRVRLEVVPEKPALFAEGFPISAEENVNQSSDDRSEDKNKYPRQRRLGSPVFRNEEYSHHERIESKRDRENSVDMDHEP
jgi:hypothetical protein